MPSYYEAHLRHAKYYASFTKCHQNERITIFREVPNLIAAFRFFTSVKGNLDEDLIEFVTTVQPALDTDAYWGELIPMLEQAQLACERKGDVGRQANFTSILAQMYTNRGNYEIALNWANKALDLAKRIGDLETLADVQRRIGWNYMYMAEFMEALNHLEEGQKFARQSNRLDILASSLHFTARVYFEKGDFKKALNYVRAEFQLPREANSLGAWAYTCLRGAAIFLELGKVKLAKRLILKSLHQFQSLGADGNVAPALRALARVSLEEGNVEEALSLLNESLQKMGYKRGEMDVRQDMTEVYFQLGFFDEAANLIEQVINYRETSNERKQLAEALYQKGRILEALGHLEEALKFYEESLHLFEMIGCLISVTEKVRLAIDRSKSIVLPNF